MSQRGDRGEGHARRPGRSSSFGGHRGGGVGGAGRGGGGPSGGQPPLSSNRSFRKPNNGHGGHQRVVSQPDTSGFQPAPAPRSLQTPPRPPAPQNVPFHVLVPASRPQHHDSSGVQAPLMSPASENPANMLPPKNIPHAAPRAPPKSSNTSAPQGGALASPGSQQAGIRGMPAHSRGFGTQDIRFDERHQFDNRTVPLPQRSVKDDAITLGPQGGLARGMSRRGQPPVSNAELPFVVDQRRMVSGPNGYNSVATLKTFCTKLNKLTPQNFVKLFAQVKELNIDNVATLTGVVSQIFDKALTKPTFCEMYANFCFQLAYALPDFSEDNEKITFKKLLLNKCQEEFERGEREEPEADKTEEEGEIKQSKEERDAKRLRARRRMLGNIRLIGELYKKRMLTERIMHECISKLLGNRQNPDEENIEALCKLMSTIGEMIDHPKAKEHMDAYFDIMQKLSTSQQLSSRVRFMLRDSIDLRKNRWQQRRKVEGPKKIEEVHRDAAQERHAQSSRLARGPVVSSVPRRGAPPMDYGPRSSAAALASPGSQQVGIRGMPAHSRGFGTQDIRLDEKHRFDEKHQFDNRTVPLPQRSVKDDAITLGPQGGLARGMSRRGQPPVSNVELPSVDQRRMVSGPNGYNSVASTVREDPSSRIQDRISGRTAPSTQSAGPSHRPASQEGRSGNKSFSEADLRDKSIAAIREYYSAKDEKEVALCIEELNAPSFYPSVVSFWVNDSFERKDMERELLAKLFVSLCNGRGNLLSKPQLIEGLASVLASLEDALSDAPRASEYLGRLFARFVMENMLALQEVGRLIEEGGEEPGYLVRDGIAADVLGAVLESIRVEKGDSFLNEAKTSSNLKLEDFRPQHLKRSKLDAFM